MNELEHNLRTIYKALLQSKKELTFVAVENEICACIVDLEKLRPPKFTEIELVTGKRGCHDSFHWLKQRLLMDVKK